MNEFALTESSALRAEYADRVEVLNEVEPVSFAVDDIATTDLVAAYFGVGVKTLGSLVFDNRTELDASGYRVISGDELTSFKKVSGIRSRAGSLALFTPRTVLNVAMLLRDSERAREIRVHLLDMALSPAQALPRDVPTALRALADEIEAHGKTKAELDFALPFALAYRDLMDADGTFEWAVVAQIFMPITGGLGRNNFLELLRSDDLKILKAKNTPYQVKGAVRYFKVTPHRSGPDADATTRVTPEGLDWLRRRLIKHFNHQPALFAIGEIA